MLIYFPQFYKQYGVRRIQSLLDPHLHTLLGLPRMSFVHYLSSDLSDTLDIDTSKPYITSARKVLIDYPLLYTHEPSGNPIRHPVVIKEETKAFHRRNKRIRYLPRHYEGIKDEQTLYINNYSYLNKVYFYPKSPMSRYWRWLNASTMVMKTIAEAENSTQLNHFIFLDPIDDIPSLSMLDTFTSRTNISILKVFTDYGSLMFLHLWRWLSKKNSQDSIFSMLKPEHLAHVNLVFSSRDGRSVILNLGYLNSWVKRKPTKTDAGEVVANNDNTNPEFNTVYQLEPGQIQKILLQFLILLDSQDTTTEPTTEVSDPTMKAPKDEQDRAEQAEIEAETAEQEEDRDGGDTVDDHEYDDGLSAAAQNPIKLDLAKKLRTEVQSDIEQQELHETDIKSQLAKVDENLEALRQLNLRKLQSRGIAITEDGEELDLDQKRMDLPVDILQQMIYNDVSAKEQLSRQIEEMASTGAYSAADYRKQLAQAQAYQEVLDPYGTGKKTVEALVVKPEELVLNQEKSHMEVSDVVLDKTMANSSLLAFDSDYVSKIITKDTLAMVDNLQKAGVIIRKHEINIDQSSMGTYENHMLELKPIDGQPSRIRFRIPRVNTDGSFLASSNKYSMRKQRIDVPLRKIDPTTVALTSYYGKTFVTLSPKKANSSLEWLIKQVNLAALEDHEHIQQVAPANVFDNHFEAPYIYNALADRYKFIKTKDLVLVFDHTEREKLVTAEVLAHHERVGVRLVGMTNKKEPVWVNKDNHFYTEKEQLGDIFDVLKLDVTKAPVDFSEVKLFSKPVSLAFVLGYSIGFHNLIKLLGARYRTVEGRQLKEMNKHEYSIGFSGISYIFDRRDREASQILGGFLEYEKLIKRFDVSEFDHKDIYLNLMESKGLGSIYIRELDLVQKLFVDPITKGILEEMKLPTTYNGLLMESNRLLMSYNHPDSQSMDAMRIRGYERIPGAIYKELVTSIRTFRNRNFAGKAKIDLGPYDVWSRIMKDPAIKLVEDINPIQNLKESEIVTYSGEGGRSKDAMNKASRAYHHTDMGIVSEATVDSSDVGINAYLSANPDFTGLRGLPSAVRKDTLTPSKLISTSALLAPGSMHDDPKRVNFVSIQQSHTIATDGYKPALLRTGYEYVIGHRTSDMFCTTAKQDGKVVEVSDKGIIVEYKDGTRSGVQLGRVFGKAEGSVYPHDITTDLAVGKAIKKGTVIAYNKGFFERDYLDPTQVTLKNAMVVKTAFYESNQTHEDSSSIARELSNQLRARTTKIKSYTVNFSQNLLDVVKVGSELHPRDILMLIEDEITSGQGGGFDEQSLRTLSKLSKQAPKSGYLGVLDKIEVFYHGDKVDMSPSLRALVDKSDKALIESCKASGKTPITGQVNSDYRVEGVPLVLDKAEVRFYITVQTDTGVGDKVVFANQLKSVIGEVMDYSMHTDTGEKVLAVFGMRSIYARVVTSPILIATTNTLLMKIGEKASKIYRSQ